MIERNASVSHRRMTGAELTVLNLARYKRGLSEVTSEDLFLTEVNGRKPSLRSLRSNFQLEVRRYW